jgi:hypothetical protein
MGPFERRKAQKKQDLISQWVNDNVSKGAGEVIDYCSQGKLSRLIKISIGEVPEEIRAAGPALNMVGRRLEKLLKGHKLAEVEYLPQETDDASRTRKPYGSGYMNDHIRVIDREHPVLVMGRLAGVQQLVAPIELDEMPVYPPGEFEKAA